MSRKIVITIADGDFKDQQLLEAAIKESVTNCHVNSVYNGAQLVKHLAKGKQGLQTVVPDLIFLDINLPSSDGFTTLKEITEKSRLSIPVCVLTTSTSEKDMLKALDLGAVAFYSKPTKYSELVEIVKTVCADCIGLC